MLYPSTVSHTTSQGFWDTCGAQLAVVSMGRGQACSVVLRLGCSLATHNFGGPEQYQSFCSAWKHFRDPALSPLQLAATLPCSAALASGVWGGAGKRPYLGSLLRLFLWALGSASPPQSPAPSLHGSRATCNYTTLSTGACLPSKNSWVFHVAREAWAAAPSQPRPVEEYPWSFISLLDICRSNHGDHQD